MDSFKKQFSDKERIDEASRVIKKYPDRIPVIVEREEGSNITNIDKKKYLVPSDLTIGQFVYVLRKRIKLQPEEAIYLFINNTLPPIATLVSLLYKEHADKDKFLYITYSGESTFG